MCQPIKGSYHVFVPFFPASPSPDENGPEAFPFSRKESSSLCAETVGEVRHPCVPQDLTRQYPKRPTDRKNHAKPHGQSPASMWDGLASRAPCSTQAHLFIRFPHLPDLQEMSIRVMEEGPSLVAPLEGRGEKLGSARAQDLVGSQAIRNPNAQFADHARAVKR